MSGTGRPSPRAGVERLGGASARLGRFWRDLSSERRLAAIAALGLFVALFLPWYQETVIAQGVTRLASISESLTGWAAFSFVEAAVLLVAAGVLFLLYMRAEGHAFHVPGGDGGVITAAGFWTCVLIVWRMFDKEGTTGHGQYATTSGIDWGIFIALGLAGVLTYAGTRIRRAHTPEPPLPGEAGPAMASAAASAPATGGATGTRVSLWERAARRAFGPPAGERPRAAPASPARPRRSRPAASARVSDPGRSGRAPEMDADETWTQHPEPPRRARPRSVSAGLVVPDAESRAGRPDAESRAGRPPAGPAPDAPPADGTRAEERRGRYRLDIADLDIADPPTSPLSRVRPAIPRRGGEADPPGGGGSSSSGGGGGPSEAATVRLSGDEAPTVVGTDGPRPAGSETPTQRVPRGRPRPGDSEPGDDQLTMRLEPPH